MLVGRGKKTTKNTLSSSTAIKIVAHQRLERGERAQSQDKEAPRGRTPPPPAAVAAVEASEGAEEALAIHDARLENSMG